jgi:hypothetical protein
MAGFSPPGADLAVRNKAHGPYISQLEALRDLRFNLSNATGGADQPGC